MTNLKLIDLESLGADLSKYASYLSPSENAHMKSIKIPARARQWLGGRIAAKLLLQRVTGLSLEQIVVEKDKSPRTKGRPFYENWFLSISHAGQIAGAALSSEPIGFDIEEIEYRPYMEQIAFPQALRDRWDHLDPEKRAEQSTMKWTELEAITKYLGTGLRIPFDRIRRPKGTLIQQAMFTHHEKRMGWTMITKPLRTTPSGDNFE